MLYNSLQFFFFYIIVTIAYWNLPNKYRWQLLLLSSCYFYMVYIPKYILVLGCTILIDYISGIYIEKISNKHVKKSLLIVSLLSNIGILLFFKYFNFLNESLDNLLSLSSHHTPFPFLDFILPIGLSFHTFQAMSYIIEVYRGNYKAEKHFGIYALYVMFYPQLVAGPIERPQNILWQFHKEQKFNFEDMKSGLMQMAFGLLKKVVIADRIAEIVDQVYKDPKAHNGKTLLVATVLYSFQIYCDFSAYSDIGIGAARTMGYKLVRNFNAPYISTSIGEFWNKWHMSLSTWFRDYLYIPLGGSRVPVARKYLNLMIVFLVSGLWHGASWTFIIWGALHGTFLIVENIKDDILKKLEITVRSNLFIKTLQCLSIFMLVTFAWIFFRSPDIATSKTILQNIFSYSIFGSFEFNLINKFSLFFSFLLIVLLLFKEKYVPVIPTKNTGVFYLVFCVTLIVSYLFGVFNNAQFIYFQF